MTKVKARLAFNEQEATNVARWFQSHAGTVHPSGWTMDTHTVCDKLPCPFHGRSGHPLRDAPMVIRNDFLDIVERVCEHGILHIDPDSMGYLNDQSFPGHASSTHRSKIALVEAEHKAACDGCCKKPDKAKAAVIADPVGKLPSSVRKRLDRLASVEDALLAAK